MTTPKALIANLCLMCCGVRQVLRGREAQGVAGPQAGKGAPRGRCSAAGRAARGAGPRRRQSLTARGCVQSMLGYRGWHPGLNWAFNGASSLELPNRKSMAF